MSAARKMTGVALAAAAAGMFMTVGVATTASAAEAGKVHCEGVNACKGKADCKTASNACKGMNSCKGKGFMIMTQAECDKAKAHMKDMDKMK